MIIFKKSDLGYKKILLFWLPLAGTWLMMSVEGPYLSAIIARMSDPIFNLAAYGVAFSFALIIESPIIMIMSAATALVEGKLSFSKLKNFTYSLNIALTFLFLIILLPPVFNFIALDLINLPEKVASITQKALFIMLPWPAAIGYRRFYQGVLIKYNFTKRVAYGTVVRLATMTLTALLLYSWSSIDGAMVGAAALSAGVLAEAAASRVMSIKALKLIERSEEDSESKKLSYFDIAKFYYPLAVTSLLSLGVHPIVTFFIGQSRMSLESLAVLPVINALVFIFRSVGLSYQEVTIALMGRNFANYLPLRNFAFFAGLSVFTILGLIAFTPLSDFWFLNVAGLTSDLAQFAKTPLKIIFVIPALTFLISFQRSILVYSRKTKPITYATAIEVGGIIFILTILINYFNAVGVVAAASAFLIGRICANIYLAFPFKSSISQNKSDQIN